jgi:hypothetical protein
VRYNRAHLASAAKQWLSPLPAKRRSNAPVRDAALFFQQTKLCEWAKRPMKILRAIIARWSPKLKKNSKKNSGFFRGASINKILTGNPRRESAHQMGV